MDLQLEVVGVEPEAKRRVKAPKEQKLAGRGQE
jgi:hypothetical protein